MRVFALISLLFVAGCTPRVITKVEMPEPPKVLMQPPKPLKPIIAEEKPKNVSPQ